jgi:SpoIIAA-like
MPLTWTIDHETKMAITVAIGDITRADMETMLNAMEEAGAAPYRKLFEASRGVNAMSTDDIMAIGWRLRSTQGLSAPMGPLALVLPSSMMEAVSRVVGMLAIAERPLRVFTDAGEARRWIEKQPVPE